MDFIIEGKYVSLETGKEISFIEEFKDTEHLFYFVCDLLKSYATDIVYNIYNGNGEKIHCPW